MSNRDEIARLTAELDALKRSRAEWEEIAHKAARAEDEALARAEAAEARIADTERRIRHWRKRVQRAWTAAENVIAIIEGYEGTTGETVAEDEDAAVLWHARRTLRTIEAAIARRDAPATSPPVAVRRAEETCRKCVNGWVNAPKAHLPPIPCPACAPREEPRPTPRLRDVSEKSRRPDLVAGARVCIFGGGSGALMDADEGGHLIVRLDTGVTIYADPWDVSVCPKEPRPEKEGGA